MTKKRIEYLDLIKFITIFCVIWDHVTQYGIKDTVDAGLYHPSAEFFVSFNIPLFMLISGIFASSTLKLPFFNMVGKKFMQIILPALIWTTVTMVILTIRGRNVFELQSPLGWIIGEYWFLKSLFICIIVFYVSMRIFKNDKLASGISILVSLLLPQGSYLWVNSMLPFFWMGHFLKNFLINGKISNTLYIILGLLFVTLLFEWNIKDYSIYYVATNLFNYETLKLDFHNLYVSFFRFVIGACGALFVLFTTKHIYDKFSRTKIIQAFSKFGKETLGIYLIQQIAVVFLASLYAFPQSVNIIVFDFVYAHIYNVLILLISLTIIRILDKHKITRVLFLGK